MIDSIEIPTAILETPELPLEFRHYLSLFERYIIISGLGGRIAISYCYFRLSVVELAMVKNSRVQLETNKFVILLLKLMRVFLPPSATGGLCKAENQKAESQKAENL